VIYDYNNIPTHLRAGLDRYASLGVPPGGCLRAALENNFLEFFKRADPETTAAAGAIAAYLYNEMPHNCHGSEEAVEAWIEKHLERTRSEAEVTP
jgi:hypothetical protein